MKLLFPDLKHRSASRVPIPIDQEDAAILFANQVAAFFSECDPVIQSVNFRFQAAIMVVIHAVEFPIWLTPSVSPEDRAKSISVELHNKQQSCRHCPWSYDDAR